MIPSDKMQKKPLVSVIITCFNQGRFLREAVASVQKQTHLNVEIIVVDDGSTDNTRHVAVSLVNVKYFYQPNRGLSAARNHGVAHSNGLYIAFLDADDILYPEAIGCNLKYLFQNPAWAFVSGGHVKVDELLYPLEDQDEGVSVSGDHFKALLRGNYIGMHATVMYRRMVFDEFQFDTNLQAAEDYDLYFKIARKYPVGAHTQKVAAYRHHGENMSARIYHMFTRVRKVHRRQLSSLRNEEERKAWQDGVVIWENYYAAQLYRKLFVAIGRDPGWPTFGEMKLLAGAMPSGFGDYVVRKIRHNFRDRVKHLLPHSILRLLHRAGFYMHYTPPPGKIRPGDFGRVTPFSADFGFDRGGAIDRFYIERFLEENQHHVRGKVLEIGDNAYTLKYGGDKILRSDIFHVDRGNSRATYIGDITDVPQIPSNEFDCIIFTQTLHLIYDFKSALTTCYRILKPGGCLLLTVPGISHIDRGEWRDYWLWSFTDTSIKRLMADSFNGSSVQVNTYGNVYVAAAFLYGMGLPEFRKDFLFQHDPSYQVIISAAAVKA
ncbi:MAG: glycosyltransferase [Cyclobacteriaceae bacterium]